MAIQTGKPRVEIPALSTDTPDYLAAIAAAIYSGDISDAKASLLLKCYELAVYDKLGATKGGSPPAIGGA